MDRIFLGIVGAAYFVLAGWCSLSPVQTSKSVGFELNAGAGQSEFLTVYGGLEAALGVIFFWGVFRPTEIAFPLFVCLVIHAGLVLFRTAGFFVFSGFSSTTYVVASIEWIIFLFAALLCWLRK